MEEEHYFKNFFYNNQGNGCHKLVHYLDLYQKHFNHLKGQKVRFLEIGVYRGGSIGMWQNFFSPDSELFFLDIDPNCKEHEKGNAKVLIGDQTDYSFLQSVADQYGPFDVVIDDGGHTMEQQTVSLQVLFSAVKDGGIYWIEDTHTSYFPAFGGGLCKENSFIEICKRLIDVMYAQYSREPDKLKPEPMTYLLNGITFHDSVVVIDKKRREPSEYKISAHGEIIDVDDFTVRLLK